MRFESWDRVLVVVVVVAAVPSSWVMFLLPRVVVAMMCLVVRCHYHYHYHCHGCFEAMMVAALISFSESVLPEVVWRCCALLVPSVCVGGPTPSIGGICELLVLAWPR